MSVFRDILRRLTLERVRYVVVGGVAVVLHGHLRATKDLDLVIDLSPEQALRAMQILKECGLQPLVPVDAEQFADPATRREWIETKNMMVLQMRDPSDIRRSVDLFVDYPIPFEDLWQRAERLRIDDVVVTVASIDDMLIMKRKAGRAQDLDDITHSNASRSFAMQNDERPSFWPDARDELKEILAFTTPSQRLEWLEEVLDLAAASGGLAIAHALDSETEE